MSHGREQLAHELAGLGGRVGASAYRRHPEAAQERRIGHDAHNLRVALERSCNLVGGDTGGNRDHQGVAQARLSKRARYLAHDARLDRQDDRVSGKARCSVSNRVHSVLARERDALCLAGVCYGDARGGHALDVEQPCTDGRAHPPASDNQHRAEALRYGFSHLQCHSTHQKVIPYYNLFTSSARLL